MEDHRNGACEEVTMRHCTFTTACREFFGLKHGQTSEDFATEIRQLMKKEVADFIVMFRTVGYDVVLDSQMMTNRPKGPVGNRIGEEVLFRS
jgi:hypothetical protein